MNNEELIEALRFCADTDSWRGCAGCTVGDWEDCCGRLLRDAADALETAEKRIAELEAKLDEAENYIKNYKDLYLSRKREELLLAQQIPKEGEWIEDEYGYIHCSRCGMEWDEPEHPNTNYCPNCGARMKGEQE